MNKTLIKQNAKSAFKANYWFCVFSAAILTIVNYVASAALSHSSSWLAAIFAVLFLALIVNPFSVGIARFFVMNGDGKTPNSSEALYAFQNNKRDSGKPNYCHIVQVLIVRDLCLMVWYILLIIPGIIKSYAYALVPYLLADHPEWSYQECIETSQNLMNGYKMELFLLDLSFIGWHILNTFTFGILGLFYVKPYVEQAHAGFYRELVKPSVVDVEATVA